MRARLMIVSLLAFTAAYAASPYITLYRLDRALRTGDADYINAHVDWPAVRDGVVAQIDTAITGSVGTGSVDTTPDPTELPAFGAGFAHKMATTMVDKALEHEAMMARIRQYAFSATLAPPIGGDALATAPHPQPADRALRWACFDSPTTFNAQLQIGATPDPQPVSLELRLIGGTWRVVGASMPPSLMLQAAAHT